MSLNTCERRLDAGLAPGCGSGGRGSRTGNVGSLAGAHGHALARNRDGDAALFHEHAEHLVARSGEETRAADRDQPECAADPHRSGRAAGRTLTTVRTTLERFQAAGLSWPLTDVALEAKLFAAAGTKQGHRRQIEPDYIQRELKRKHVTLSLLWERVH